MLLRNPYGAYEFVGMASSAVQCQRERVELRLGRLLQIRGELIRGSHRRGAIEPDLRRQMDTARAEIAGFERVVFVEHALKSEVPLDGIRQLLVRNVTPKLKRELEPEWLAANRSEGYRRSAGSSAYWQSGWCRWWSRIGAVRTECRDCRTTRHRPSQIQPGSK